MPSVLAIAGSRALDSFDGRAEHHDLVLEHTDPVAQPLVLIARRGFLGRAPSHSLRDWVAFVLHRESDAGALTKYFEKVAGDDDFKIRGIEARQRSTPQFIGNIQRDCFDWLDATWSPDAVLGRLK